MGFGKDDFGVVFDCDGVLLDSMGLWHALDDRLAARVGIEFTQADRDFMTAATILESSRYMHEKYGIGATVEEVVDIIHDDMLAFYAGEAATKPGALELVQGLAERGVPMGVASSTPSTLLRAGLEAAGFAPYLRAIVSVEDVSSTKREPLVYDTVRSALGTPRERTWGVEDALYAVRTLVGAGYRTLAVYDSEIAGAPASLAAAADCFILSFEAFTAADFAEMAARAIRREPTRTSICA